MVLRPEALRQRLLELEEVVSRLEELGRIDRDVLRQNFRDEWAVQRGLQLGAEIVLDIGNHILSAHFGVSAADYEDIITRLEVQGVIDGPTRRRLKGLAGFRNILVHDYLRLDPDRVAKALGKAPGDFNAFALAVRRWLASIDPPAV